MTWVKDMGRAYILYIYAHGRDGRAPQPSCGEQDGRKGDGTGNGEEGTGREETEDGGKYKRAVMFHNIRLYVYLVL